MRTVGVQIRFELSKQVVDQLSSCLVPETLALKLRYDFLTFTDWLLNLELWPFFRVLL
jgi:hypothetical protein